MKIEIVSARVFRPFDIEGMGFGGKVILFGGDRITVCDEVVVGTDENGAIIAVASLSPEGEGAGGEPTIVGVWVHPAHRRKRRGVAIFEEAIHRMLQRGFVDIRVDVLSMGMAKVLEAMTPWLREHIVVGHESPDDNFPE